MRQVEFQLSFSLDWRDPRVRQVLLLFLPVTMRIGIINLDVFINADLGALVSVHAPAAINDAFRIYMLPQGIFSVAVATVLFPTLSRMASRVTRADAAHGRQRDPPDQPDADPVGGAAGGAGDADRAARLPARRVHRASTDQVSTALFWFAFSLPFAGVNLLLARTFFALQRPWIPTALAAINIVVDLIVSFALYKPLGIAGLVIGTVAANVVMTWLQLGRLRRGFNGRLELGQTMKITVRILIATAIMTVVAWLIWKGLDAVLGGSLIAQVIELGVAGTVGVVLYARLVLAMRDARGPPGPRPAPRPTAARSVTRRRQWAKPRTPGDPPWPRCHDSAP